MPAPNSLGRVDLPGGGALVVKRARATASQRFEVAAPRLKEAVASAAHAASEGQTGDATAPIPVDEIVALISLLAGIILQVEGRDVMWGDMSAEERSDWLDDLGTKALLTIYMRYLWLRVTVDQPEVVEEIQARLDEAAARVEDVSEEGADGG